MYPPVTDLARPLGRKPAAVLSVPVSLGIVLDVSDSMSGKRIDDARGALDRFVGELLSQDDEAFLMVFNHRPRIVSSWTPVPAKLRNALDGVIPMGGTAVYDAIGESLEGPLGRAGFIHSF